MKHWVLTRLVAVTIPAVLAVALAPAVRAQLVSNPVYALTTTGRFLTFDADSPATINTNVPVTGLRISERLVGMDVRPATGVLYGVGSRSGLYTINPMSGVATFQTIITTLNATGNTVTFKLTGRNFGIDFNPTVDRLRIVSDAGLNARVHPDTGAVIDANPNQAGTQPDTALAYATGDANAGVTPIVVGAAYTGNDNNPLTGTTLYDIDSGLDMLATQNPPNNGTLNTVGGLGVNTTPRVGFDVTTGVLGNDSAYASLTSPGTNRSSFYTVDLATGAAHIVSLIGSGFTVVDIALPVMSVPA